MLQQRALAPRAHARDLVQRIGADGGAALLAVAADGETVGLVAQPLQIIQDRAFEIEAEGLLAGHVEMLAPGVAVGALGDSHQRHILHPQIGEDLAGDGQLSRPAIDQHQIGTPPFGIRRARSDFVLDQAGEAAGQHFAHHGVIVAGREFGGLDVEFAILVFLEAFGPGHDEGADGMRALDMGIVIDLDAARRRVQAEHLGHAFQQLASGRCSRPCGGPAARGHWSSARSMISRFSPRCGRGDFDLVSGAQRQAPRPASALSGNSSDVSSSLGAVRSS